MISPHHRGIVGILLAAGRGRRFDLAGVQDKLLQYLPSGEVVAVASASHLRTSLANVIAVIRPDSHGLRRLLGGLGCEVIECATADDGMAASLVHAIRQAQGARGWLIALADMPYVSPDTISALAQAIADGADIAVPVYRERRGNPVAFSRAHLNSLLQLEGDQGARKLLQTCPVVEVVIDDPGILRDIDTQDDLRTTPDVQGQA